MKKLIFSLSLLASVPAFANHGDVWGNFGGMRQGSCENHCLSKTNISMSDYTTCVAMCLRIRSGAEVDCDTAEIGQCEPVQTADVVR